MRELIKGPLNQGDLDFTVANIRHEGIWNWEAIKDKIIAITIQSYEVRSDFIMWNFSKDGEFSAKSAYQVAKQRGNSWEFLSSFLGLEAGHST